jgi:hypothetical protein
VKSNLIVAWAVSGAILVGCQFDRSPLTGEIGAPTKSQPDASIVLPDARMPEPGDANAGDASNSHDAAAPNDAAPVVEAGPVTPPDEEDGGKPEEPANPPMTGGLACGGTFCAFGIDPEKPCCTSAADVTQRTARAANRCGLDLSALPGGYGDHCWQRDQLGIVDDRCPNAPAANGGAAEPGCCSDDGQCGSLNADHKLGCRYSSGGAPRSCSAQPTGSSCDPTGNFGLRFSVDAAWGGRSGGLVGLTDDGRGKIDVYILLQVQNVDPMTRRLEGAAHVCGVTLPPFLSTTLCEAYQPIFPPSIWESDTLRPLPLLGRYECAGDGCVLSLDPQTYLLGFDMNNPEAPWPAAGTTNQLRCPAGSGLKCFLDHDDDGQPGVRVEVQSGGYAMGGTGCRSRYEYRGAPLSSSVAAIFDGVRRTDRLELGIRTKLGGAVRLADDCDSAHGSALAEYVNSRAAGCWVEPGTYNFPNGVGAGQNERCQSREVTFLDENLPVYLLLSAGQTPDAGLNLADKSASNGPEIRLARLKGSDCAAVRDAKY